MALDGKAVSSGTTLSEAGTLKLTVTDEAGNASSAEIKLTRVDSGAPAITLKINEKNVIAGVTATVKDNQLLFDQDVAASWSDDYTAACKAELSLTAAAGIAKAINSGDKLTDAGTLKLTVKDDFDNSSTAVINLTAIAVFGVENLQNLTLQVDQEADLMSGLTIAEGLTLQKVEMVQDGERTVIETPNAYTPEYPGSIGVILTLARTDGSTIEVKVENLTVKPLGYQAISIIDIKPVDVFPQIAQIEA